ncbi:hypothetical protein RB594_006563 [Gaeumannomyces avenae]
MRIACLQFSAQAGDLNNNLNRADAVLNQADPRDIENLDLLVLPEMAFTGNDFKSLKEIAPLLEASGSDISALWARATALELNCKVAVGYPEKFNNSFGISSISGEPYEPKYSLLLVDEGGRTLANYQKRHLNHPKEAWFSKGINNFFYNEIQGLNKTAMGIGMDISPFTAPWHEFEFAFHVLDSSAGLVILSMAWGTVNDDKSFCSKPYEPDMATLEYWVQRMEPLIRADFENEIIVIFANRCGFDEGTMYAGTSTVLGIQDGEVKVYGVLGRSVEQLLVVDTDNGPFAKLIHRPQRVAEEKYQKSSMPFGPALFPGYRRETRQNKLCVTNLHTWPPLLNVPDICPSPPRELPSMLPAHPTAEPLAENTSQPPGLSPKQQQKLALPRLVIPSFENTERRADNSLQSVRHFNVDLDTFIEPSYEEFPFILVINSGSF